ncbi:MAG: alanine racemase [Vulcanimicrobiota bacterium]
MSKDYQKYLENGLNNGAWVEVNLDAVSENFDTVRSLVGYKTKICAVVKADGYGHGVAETGRLLEKKGADYLAVAILDEGIELRKNGITCPILVLGPLMPGQASYVLRYDLTQTICSADMAAELSAEAKRVGRKARIHIKVDTGMGRLGVHHSEAVEEIKKIGSLPYLDLEGIFTHYATSDSEDKAYVLEQWDNFNRVRAGLRNENINIPIAHVATSATIIDLPFMNLDMVRPGLMLYGLYPRASMREKVELKPALSLKAKISFLKEMKTRQSISYGRKYFAEEGQKIATMPLGYNDGIRRILTGNSQVLIQGQRCPVVGTICMDHIMADVTNLEKVDRFEKVVIIGVNGKEEIAVDEIAGSLNTINYEVVSSLGSRLPRLYFKRGQIVAIKNLLGYHSIESLVPSTDTVEIELDSQTEELAKA